MPRRAGTSQRAWTTTERVADPANNQIMGPVHSDGSRGRGNPSGPTRAGLGKSTMNKSSPATAMTLAMKGAQANAPNRPRALRIWPSRAKSP